jgi:hypothetical protein
MDDKISKYQEVSVILAFLKHSDSKGNVDFKETYIGSDLSEIIWNGNWVDSLLYALNETGVLSYEEIGEDGFAPIIIAGITKKTHEYLAGLISNLEAERASLETRITEILTFNPNLLSKNINDTKAKLDEVDILIKGNDLLGPMAKPLKEIRHHFESVSAVSSNYEDIYKNIIRPVQEEGRSGVKATVKWAVISIFVSTGISLIVSNWDKISPLFTSA